MTVFTCTLDEINSESIPLVGGKGANLGELTRAGLPVPHAFCVTTSAYQRLIEGNDLWARMAAVLEGLNYDDALDIGRGGKKIRDMIVESVVPGEIGAEIGKRYAQLESQLGADVLVSVRSSATAEDLPGMSFAGQQDTYLNVGGLDNVLQHVKRCWASLWTDRAIAYRHRQGFRHEDVLLAVVVQEMFPSEVAGVLFTANPVTSNPNEIFLNTSWGLGEAIVSGKVNPDQYILNKKNLKIKDKKIHDKLLMTVRREDGQGSVEAEVPEARRKAETLSDDKVKELGRIALRIEKHYGFPQDIEWGYCNGRFAILQSREITAADLDFSDGLEAWQTPAARQAVTDERWLWSRAYSDEAQTGPSTPLFYSEMQPGMTVNKWNRLLFTDTMKSLSFDFEAGFYDIPCFRWYCARAYFNLDWEKEHVRMWTPPFARTDELLWRFPAEEREEIRKVPFNWVRYLWVLIKLHVTNPRISLTESTYHLYENLERWSDHAESLWEDVDLDSATPKEILATFDRAMAENGYKDNFKENILMPFSVYMGTLQVLLQKLLARWCGDKNLQLYSHLVAGLHTKTSEESLAVWKLSRTIRKSPTLMALLKNDNVAEILVAMDESQDGRAFKADLQEFLKKYGHRGGKERDPYHHRWRHKPELVFHSIKPMLALGDEDSPVTNEERLYQRMLKTKEDCIRKAGKSRLWFGPLRAVVLRWLINLTQDYLYYRDFERFHNDKRLARPRDMYVAIAKNYIKRGLMVETEDIFFLGKEEVVLVDDGKMSAREIAIRVRARRRVYDRYTHREPAKYLRGWNTFEDDRLPDDGKGLRGIAASAGTVTGRARVCRKLEEISKIKKGEILVTVATDPAWTTVFSIIAGVVVETGGVVAHAVMISREYGIPCVANLTQACDLIPDGSLITVDGTNGRVIVHKEGNG